MPISQTFSDLIKIYPELFIIVSIALLLFQKYFQKTPYAKHGPLLLSFIILLLTLLQNYQGETLIFSNSIGIDTFGSFFKVFTITFGIICLVLFPNNSKHKFQTPILFLIILGCYLASGSVNLISLFLSLEIISLGSYLMLFFDDKPNHSVVVKHIIYGMVSSAIMLFGISIIYGLSSSVNYYEISSFLSSNKTNNITLLFSFLMILAGFGFKLSLAPFHFTHTDISKDSSFSVSLTLSVITKIGVFAALIRFLITIFQNTKLQNTDYIGWNFLSTLPFNEILAIISASSIITGVLVAFWQSNLKRLLSFITIAQCGYILMSIIGLSQSNISYALYSILSFAVSLSVSYYCLMLFEKYSDVTEVNNLRGLLYQSPLLAVTFIISLLSLTGIPLTIGFPPKLFSHINSLSNGMLWLAVVGIISIVVTGILFIRIISHLFSKSESNIKLKKTESALLYISMFIIVLGGIFLYQIHYVLSPILHIFII